MKNLLLMRGLPGSGKSNWIKENGLEEHVLSADQFRDLLSSPVQCVNGEFRTDQSISSKAWKMLFIFLEERMKKGDFVVVDATHVGDKGLEKYRNLSEIYGYRVFCKTMNVDVEECISRQPYRPEKERVPVSVIRKMDESLKKFHLPDWITEIDRAEDMNDLRSDFKWDRVKVIGDVHSHYDEMIEKVGEISPDTLYVFCGDILDNGDQPMETLEFVFEHMHDDNFIFVEGNHDSRLRSVVRGELYRQPPDTKKTFRQLFTGKKDGERQEILDKIAEFTRIMKTCFCLDYGDMSILFSHGGIAAPVDPENLPFVPSKMFTCGVGGHETDIDKIWDAHSDRDQWQVHGHRPSHSHGSSVCLDVADGKVSAAEFKINLFSGRITYELI